MPRFWLKLLLRLSLTIALLSSALIFLMQPIGQWLPRGGWLAFMANVDVYNWDIFLLDANRQLIHHMTRDPTNERYPAWSPDGRKIAYHSDRNGRWEIFISSLDGRDVVQLTGENMNAYTQTDPDQPCKETIDAQGYTVYICGGLEGNVMAAWSPDGERIAFHSDLHGHWDLYSIATDGTDIQPISTRAGDEVLADWSPDGQQILYTAGTTGFMFVHRIDADGRNRRRLTKLEDVMLPDTDTISTPSQTLEDWHPNWSPDGTRIVFISNRGGGTSLYLMDADGQNLQQIPNRFLRNYNPIWQDDETIIFSAYDSGVMQMYSIKTDGSDLKPFFWFDKEVDAPAWHRPN